MPNYKCSVKGQFSNALTWSFGARLNSASSLVDVGALWHNAWVTAWNDATNGLHQFYPVSTQMTGTRVAQTNATFHEIQNSETDQILPGTAAGDTLPYQESTLVSQRSSFSARWDRGRFYLPAMEETMVNNNVIDPAVGAKLQIAINGVFNAITAGGNTVFVASLRPHKGDVAPFPTQYTTQTILKWDVARKPARQSRRVKKVPASYFQ